MDRRAFLTGTGATASSALVLVPTKANAWYLILGRALAGFVGRTIGGNIVKRVIRRQAAKAVQKRTKQYILGTGGVYEKSAIRYSDKAMADRLLIQTGRYAGKESAQYLYDYTTALYENNNGGNEIVTSDNRIGGYTGQDLPTVGFVVGKYATSVPMILAPYVAGLDRASEFVFRSGRYSKDEIAGLFYPVGVLERGLSITRGFQMARIFGNFGHA